MIIHNDFPCLKCGSCCKLVGFVVTSAREFIAEDPDQEIMPQLKETAEFPIEFNAETGKCSWLKDDNTCKDYENRPNICKTSATFDKHYRVNHTHDEYLKASAIVCRELRKIVETKDSENAE